MPETSKKSSKKKATTKAVKADNQSTAAAAPKKQTSRAKTSKKATAEVAAKTTTKTASHKRAADSEQPHIHYTTEPSRFKTSLSKASNSAVRTVRQPKFWLVVGGVIATVFIALVLLWQWQRSYIAVVGNQYLPVSMMDDQLRANYGNNAVNSVIQQQLILQEGARQHIKITDKQIDNELAKIKTSSGGQDNYSKQLQQLGISESLLQYQVRVQLTQQALLKDKIQVSDKEISDYYDQNKSTIDPNGTTGLAGLKDQIQQTLQQQKLSSATADYVNSLRQRTHVETDLGHLSLTFGEFLQQTIWPIPTDIWNFVSGKK